jgi:hypothetical protein
MQPSSSPLTPRAAWVRGMALPEDQTGQIMSALVIHKYACINDIAWEDAHAFVTLPQIAELPPGVKARLRRELGKLKVIVCSAGSGLTDACRKCLCSVLRELHGVRLYIKDTIIHFAWTHRWCKLQHVFGASCRLSSYLLFMCACVMHTWYTWFCGTMR